MGQLNHDEFIKALQGDPSKKNLVPVAKTMGNIGFRGTELSQQMKDQALSAVGITPKTSAWEKYAGAFTVGAGNANNVSTSIAGGATGNTQTGTGDSSGGSSDVSALIEAMKGINNAKADTSGAMGYGEYLKNFGSNTQENYGAAVRAANDDYYRSLMTYGKNAEALAGSGLTGAGVSNYGNSAAWAARQGAVATAGAAKQEADAANARSFAEYLQNYRAQEEAKVQQEKANKLTALTNLSTLGLTDQNAMMEYLKAAGFDDQSAADVSAAFVANNKAVTDANTEALNQQTAVSATTAFDNALASGMTNEQALAEIRSLYGDDVANSLWETKKTGVINSIDTMIKSAEVPTSGYSPIAEGNELSVAMLDQYRAQYGMDDETYNGYRDRIWAMNDKWLEGLVEDAADSERVLDACAALGIEVTNEDDGVANGEAAAIALRDATFELYKRGEIGADTARKVLESQYDMQIEALWDERAKGEEFFNSLSQFKTFADKIGDDALYQELLDKTCEDFSILYDEYNNLYLVGKNGRREEITIRIVDFGGTVPKNDFREFEINRNDGSSIRCAIDSDLNLYTYTGEGEKGSWKESCVEYGFYNKTYEGEMGNVVKQFFSKILLAQYAKGGVETIGANEPPKQKTALDLKYKQIG